MMTNTTFNKFPSVQINGSTPNAACRGWESITDRLKNKIRTGLSFDERPVVAVECYQGVAFAELQQRFQEAFSGCAIFDTREAFKTEDEIHSIVYPDVTDDPVFGYMTRLTLDDFFDAGRVSCLQEQIAVEMNTPAALVFIIGPGALKLWHEPTLIIYADMPRWEIQQRQRRHECDNLGLSNRDISAKLLYKQSYFVDWRVLDRWKRVTLPRADFILDTSRFNDPRMVDGESFFAALHQIVNQPFELVPFFDPGVWGGEWMRKHCDLDNEAPNYAWCFNCVPEENTIALRFDDVELEVPAQNIVIFESCALLGDPVFARFGAEFPIRFDLLDTMDGQNLSFQVHPLTQYIREQFGMHYTQDESYYILDAGNDSHVYLGLTDQADEVTMRAALEEAQAGRAPFDAEHFVATWPVAKHDHVLIPAGTPHCSGANCVVLEISATPYIFTFKLWDWGRLDLDGNPRPINMDHGFLNIQWERRREWVRANLINHVETVTQGNGWREERTGLHALEFIETRRHWFTEPVHHNTGGQDVGSVNVLCLVEGAQIVVESPNEAFAPFIVNYAETFVIPAVVGEYIIRPHGPSVGHQCATMKAWVRR